MSDDDLNAARGIVYALVCAAVLWGLIGLVVYFS
jgi:hypothetical protein